MMLGMYNGYLVRLAAYMTVYQLFLIPMLCKSPKYAKIFSTDFASTYNCNYGISLLVVDDCT